jgi:hypothetical protein
MNGRIRKLGFAGLVGGGTLLFGIGFAGAQSSASGGNGVGDRPTVLIAHPNDGHVMIGGSAGSSGCGGDGGATAAAVSSIDL